MEKGRELFDGMMKPPGSLGLFERYAVQALEVAKTTARLSEVL